jgi:hypothetical protein
VTINNARRTKDAGRQGKRWRSVLCPLSVVLAAAAGCTFDQLNPFAKDDLP